MEHLVGYIIIGLSVLLTGGFLIWKWVSWKRAMPKVYHRGIGMRYLPGAVVPWENWQRCIDACLNTIEKHPEFRKDFDKLTDFWVEVVPYESPLINITSLTGWTDGKRSVPKPTTEEEAKTRMRVVGSVKTERFLPFTKKQHVIQVVQLRQGSEIDTRLMRSTGLVKPMNQSAFFYEFAKRHVEFVLTGNLLELTTVEPEFHELEDLIEKEFAQGG